MITRYRALTPEHRTVAQSIALTIVALLLMTAIKLIFGWAVAGICWLAYVCICIGLAIKLQNSKS